MLADDDIGGRSRPDRPRLSREARRVALSSLLQQHPEAWVVAIQPSGHFTAMPDSLALAGQRVIQGPASALEMVVPGDRPVVVEAWARAVTDGGANDSVHAYGNASRVVGLHLLDQTEDHGVYIGVFLGYGAGAPPEAAEEQWLAPRTSVVHKDQVGVITAVDEAATAILGWRTEDLIGHRSLEFIHPDDQERAVANWMDMVARPAASQRVRLRHQHRDGSWIWLEITNHNRLADPVDACVLAEHVDVTEEVTAIEALRANERVLRRLTEALPVGVLYVGADGTIDYGNERLAAIVGVDWATTLDEQFASAVGDGREVLRGAVTAVLQGGRDQDVSVSFNPPRAGQPGDRTVHCDVSLRAVINEAGEVVGAIVCVTDTTEDIKLREELRDQARYDLLTGCLNHASVMQELAERLPTAREAELTVAVFIDLDDFKGINDRHGHAAGDHVLRQVAHRLHDVASGDDLVGRLGGDEFLVVMRTAEDPRALSRITGLLAAALDRGIQWEHGWIAPGASVGLAFAPAGCGLSADALVSSADAAMYESKRTGGTPVIVEAHSAQ